MSLTGLQIALYIIPWLILPYLLRVLGPDAWGRVAVAQLTIGWLSTLTMWGFPWTVTRKVAAQIDNQAALSKTLTNSWAAQILLASAAVITLLIICHIIPFLSEDKELYLYGCGLVMAGVLFPTCYFNGVERMFEVAVVQLLCRAVGVIPLFIFVKAPEDAPIVIAIAAYSTALVSIAAVFFNRKNIPLKFQLLSFAFVFRELREGASMFFSTGWLALQSSLITMVLGQVAGATSVGNYSLADRVRTGAQSIVGPIFQASFPRMASLWSFSENNAQSFLLRLLIVSLGITLTIGLVCGFFADRIVLILGGDAYQASAHLLRWMAPIIVLSALTNFFSLQIMVANGRIRAFNLILFWVGLGCVVCVYPMIYWLGAEGAVVLLLLLESALAGSTLVYVLRSKLLTKRFNQLGKNNL